MTGSAGGHASGEVDRVTDHRRQWELGMKVLSSSPPRPPPWCWPPRGRDGPRRAGRRDRGGVQHRLLCELRGSGDANYAEVAVTGTFKGNAAIAFQQLRLYDEKTDGIATTATLTIAERARTDGSGRYRNFPNQEYHTSTGAGYATFNPPDYSAPRWTNTSGRRGPTTPALRDPCWVRTSSPPHWASSSARNRPTPFPTNRTEGTWV